MGKKTKLGKRKLVLLDAHAIIHRAYHALPDFSSSKGIPTGALYGLATMLIRIVADLKPDAVAACYDLPKPTYRHEAYAEYKAGRAKADDALVDQLQRSREVFAAFNVPCLSAEGFEADDLLGTLSSRFSQEGTTDVVIASGDMDTLQLVEGTHVQVFTLKKGISDTILYDENAVVKRFGFLPKQIPDYKGLAGDPSDNIIGVRGIGDKTATILIKTFGTVEGIYEALAKKGEDEVVKMSGVTPRIVKLLVEHEEEARFSKMLATIRRDAPVTYEIPAEPYLQTVDIDAVQKLCVEYDFRTLLARFKTSLGMGETMSLGLKEDDGTQKESGNSLFVATPKEVVDPNDLKETTLALWVLQSNKTDPTLEDVLAYAQTESFSIAKKFIFDELAKRADTVFETIEKPLIPIIDGMEKKGVQIDRAYLAMLQKEYSEKIAAIEKQAHILAGKEFNLSSPKQLGEILYDDLQIGVGKRIKKTEGGARSTREDVLAKLADAHPIIPLVLQHRELSKLLGTYIEPLPLSADSQGRIHARFILSGTTTGRMASKEPNLQNIPISTEHGKRVRRAFVAPLGRLLLAIDYSQIELRIAAILSRDPAFIEIFTQGRDIHAAVAARVFGKEESLVTVEERRAAKAINFGILYGMGVNALRESLSQGGKKITQIEAQTFLDDYFAAFPRLAVFLDETKGLAARRGYTETLFGRRRYLDGLSSRIPYIRAAAERMAINAPVQGTEADVVKIAMKRVDDFLKQENLEQDAALILQVHDELVFEVNEKKAASLAKQLCAVMEDIVPKEKTFGVRLSVEASVGKNWEDMESV